MQEILDVQLHYRQNRLPYVLATVIEIIGSASAKPAAKAIIASSGQLITGWVGGGCAQNMIITSALQCLTTGEPEVIDIDLTDEIFGAGMPCGGSMRVYLEPITPKPLLWLVGHGRIIEALYDFAVCVGFDVILNDHNLKIERFPAAIRLITDDMRYAKLQAQANDYVIIATHHKGDYEALTQVLVSDANYIALVASVKRTELVLSRLTQQGISADQLARLHAPAGLDLGAKTPEEIALAVISEMVLHRRGGNGQPMRLKITAQK